MPRQRFRGLRSNEISIELATRVSRLSFEGLSTGQMCRRLGVTRERLKAMRCAARKAGLRVAEAIRDDPNELFEEDGPPVPRCQCGLAIDEDHQTCDLNVARFARSGDSATGA